jgi:hypothetical protein
MAKKWRKSLRHDELVGLKTPEEIFGYLNGKGSKIGESIIDKTGREHRGDHRAQALADHYARPVEKLGSFDENNWRHVESTVRRYLELPYGRLPVNDDWGKPFEMKELLKALRSFPAGKAPGPDGVRPWMLKWAPEDQLRRLLSILNSCLRTGRVVDSWGVSTVSPAHKKREPLDNPKSYRPITLSPLSCKVLSKMIFNRCETIANKLLPDAQGGFRKLRGCPELIVTLKEICEYRRFDDVKTFLAFLDVANAFPSTWRSGMFAKLFEKLGNNRITRLIYELYTNDRCRVAIQNVESEMWKTTDGVKTGDPLSPLLFIVYFSDLITELNDSGCGVQINGIRIPAFFFADDVVLLAGTSEELQQSLDVATRFANKWRFVFNTKKGKSDALVYGRNDLDPRLSWQLGGSTIEEADSYKYLGAIFDMDNAWKSDLEATLKKARQRLGNCLHAGMGNYFDLKQSRVIAGLGILPLIEYNSAAWGGSSHAKTLLTFWNQVCRKAAGVHGFASAAVTRAITGLPQLKARWAATQAKFLFRILGMPHERLVAHVFKARAEQYHGALPFKKKSFWLHEVIGSLQYLGLPYEISPGCQGYIGNIEANDWKKNVAKGIWAAEKRELQEAAEAIGLSNEIIDEIQKGGIRKEITFLPKAQRSMLLQLVGGSLPVQACRQSCKGERVGGWSADEVCILCKATNETIFHFLFECPRLRHYRATLQTLSTLDKKEFESELLKAKPQLLQDVVRLWVQRRKIILQDPNNAKFIKKLML